MDLAALEIEVHAPQRLDAAEMLDDAAHHEQRRDGFSRRAHRGLPQERGSLRVTSRRMARRAVAVAGVPRRVPLTTWETVETETPASRATAAIVDTPSPVSHPVRSPSPPRRRRLLLIATLAYRNVCATVSKAVRFCDCDGFPRVRRPRAPHGACSRQKAWTRGFVTPARRGQAARYGRRPQLRRRRRGRSCGAGAREKDKPRLY